MEARTFLNRRTAAAVITLALAGVVVFVLATRFSGDSADTTGPRVIIFRAAGGDTSAFSQLPRLSNAVTVTDLASLRREAATPSMIIIDASALPALGAGDLAAYSKAGSPIAGVDVSTMQLYELTGAYASLVDSVPAYAATLAAEPPPSSPYVTFVWSSGPDGSGPSYGGDTRMPINDPLFARVFEEYRARAQR